MGNRWLNLGIVLLILVVAFVVYQYFPSLSQTESKDGFEELKSMAILDGEYVGAIRFDEFRVEQAELSEISGAKNQILEFKASVREANYSGSEALNALADLLILKTKIFDDIVRIAQADQGFNVTVDSSDDEICGKLPFLESGKNHFISYTTDLAQFAEKKFAFMQSYSDFVPRAGLVDENIGLEELEEEKNKLSDSYTFFQTFCEAA